MEVLAELRDCLIEGLDGAVGAGEHHTAFHGDEDEGGERVDVGAARHGRLHFEEAFAHGLDPTLEIVGNQVVGGRIFRVDFKGETADGAAVLAASRKDALAIAGEDGKDTFQGFAGGREGGIDDHGAEKLCILLEHGAEQGFLAVEEVIEASGVDVGVGEKFGHAGAGESAFPKEEAGGIDQAIAG